MSLIADPGVASSIPDRFHTFVEIDHGIISSSSLPLNHSTTTTTTKATAVTGNVYLEFPAVIGVTNDMISNK